MRISELIEKQIPVSYIRSKNGQEPAIADGKTIKLQRKNLVHERLSLRRTMLQSIQQLDGSSSRLEYLRMRIEEITEAIDGDDGSFLKG